MFDSCCTGIDVETIAVSCVGRFFVLRWLWQGDNCLRPAGGAECCLLLLRGGVSHVGII